MTDKKNKKIPESDAKWEYPWNQVTQTLGGHEIHYNSTPNEESTRIVHPSGSYEENTKDGHQVKLVVNQKNSLVSNGASDTVEGARDVMSVGGIRGVNLGGLQEEIAKHMSIGVNGQTIHASKGTVTQYTSSDHHKIVAGTEVKRVNDGNNYSYSMGPLVTTTTDSHILGASKDLMVFSGQNADIYASSKARFASKEDMRVESNSNITIKADTKITLKVGDNASITISDGLIEIKATKINLTATGELNANGHPLKINGGGPTSTPTQWP